MSDVTEHSSICRFCSVGCPITVEMQDGLPIRVTGNKRSPSYDGFCCTRGQALVEHIRHPDRLLHSLKRRPDGEYTPIGSQQVIDEVAAKIRALVDEHGAKSVAVYFGTQAGPYPLIGPTVGAWAGALGTPMIFSSMTIDQPGKDIATALLGGWEAGPQTFTDADVWMIVGANPLVSIGGALPAHNPGKRLTEAVRRGMKLIVIDPRRTETATRAHIHLQPRPAEDVSILAAMIHVILDEELYDRDFVLENVDGLEALKAAVAPYTPAYAAARADMPAELIIDAARMFATSRRGVAIGSTGANMSGHSSLVEYLIQCLNTICGRFVRAGEAINNPGVFLTPAAPKAQPRPPRPASGFGEKLSVRDLTASACGMPTAALADEILSGKIKALFSVGGNPVAAFPDQERTIRALQKLDLFVQFDIRMSASAKLASYVVAPKVTFEVPTLSYGKEAIELYGGVWQMPDPFGMYAPKLMEPPPGSDVIEEWEFFYRLSQRLGLELAFRHYGSASGPTRTRRPTVRVDMTRKPTSDELLALLTAGGRISLEEVKKHPDGALFPGEAVVAPKDPDCTARLQVADPGMMEELKSVQGEPIVAQRSASHPFMLVARRLGHVLNSSGFDLPLLVRKGGGRYNPAFMHPADLEALGVQAGECVELSSEHGTIPAIVQPDASLRRGLVSMAHAYGRLPSEKADVREHGSNTGVLCSVEDDYDRHSGIPRMSAVPVRVDRLAVAEAV